MDQIPQIPKPKTEPPKLGGFTTEKHAIAVARQDIYRKVKSIWFSLLFLGSSGLTAWTFEQSWFKGGGTPQWNWFGLALTLLLTSCGFAALLFKLRSFIILSVIAAALIIVPFRNTFSYLTLSYIWLLPLAGFLLAAVSLRQRSRETLRIKFAGLVRSNTGPVFGGLAILFAIFYYVGLVAGGVPQKPFFTESSVRGLLKNLEWGVQTLYPGFNADMTIDDVLLMLTKQQLSLSMPSDVSNLPLFEKLAKPEEREKLQELTPDLTAELLTKETKRALLTNLSKLFGQPLSGKEKLSGVLHRYFSTQYDKIPEPTRQTALWIWIGIVFVALWSFGFIFRMLAGILGWILLQFFIGLKFVKIDHEPTERQVMVLA